MYAALLAEVLGTGVWGPLWQKGVILQSARSSYGNQLAELWDFAACQKYEDQLAELWPRAGRAMGSLLIQITEHGDKSMGTPSGDPIFVFSFFNTIPPPIDRQEWGAPKFPGCTLKYKDPSSHFPCSLGSCI